MATQSRSTSLEVLSGGAGLEAVGGVAAGILAILGLVGVAPLMMTTISAIVLGAALLFEGVSAGAEFQKLGGEQGRLAMAELGGGTTVAVLGGIAAVVLGLLALLGVAQGILLPVAAIVIGGAVTMSAGVPARLSTLRQWNGSDAQTNALRLGAGVDVLAGISSLILGILALVGIAPAILTQVALLSSSAALLLGGLAVGGTSTVGRHITCKCPPAKSLIPLRAATHFRQTR